MIEIMPEKRAIHIADLNAVVVADLHIGYEEELRREGVELGDSTLKMINALETLLQITGANKLIILGDVKHSIGPCRKIKEIERLPAEIHVVKGNHDGGIEELLDAHVYPATGFTMGKFGFIHGHSWPSEEVMRSRYVFMGHLHPEIELTDSNGKVHRYPCFLRGSLTEEGEMKYHARPAIFVLPAFNPLVGSSLADPLGPLMKNKIIGDFEVYLLNGAYLGKLDDIQRSARSL
ncbi:MAG: metallophosphoesterase [Euryarchaeota archaeon]|nr:metallophosphoesterase [Euryarchaeota archaeon]